MANKESSENQSLNEVERTDEDFEVEEDTECGFGSCKGDTVLASKKSFILAYTLSAMVFTASGSYTSGIISTLEKQYKLSSSKIGIMYAFEDVMSGIIAVLIPYYTSRGHYPRWISFGLFLLGVSLILQSSPYAIYGPGSDALSLTEEFGNENALNMTLDNIYQRSFLNLCSQNKSSIPRCSKTEVSEYRGATLIIAFASSFAGCGQQFFNTLGTTFMDNNIKKSKIPIIYSVFRFLRLLAPSIGFNTASYFLTFYVAPGLTPTINNRDPRWIGRWWAGYLVFAGFAFVFVPIMATFPRILPRAALRKKEEKLAKLEKLKEEEDQGLMETEEPRNLETEKTEKVTKFEKASLSDLYVTIKRLLTNKVYFCNTMAAIFYVFGYVPYGFFMNKYLQIQYLLSPSYANTMTGSVAFIASAVGLLSAGIVITIFKPKARYLAGWNIVTSLISAFGLMAYAFLGCQANQNKFIMQNSIEKSACNMDCQCNFVKYAPVCGSDGMSYISACHAGCQSETKLANGSKIFTNCNCVNPNFEKTFLSLPEHTAKPSPCPVDCFNQFYIFLVVVCINKFIGGTEGATNFLMGLRCVEEKDKAVSIGLTSAIIKFFAVIPSPIVFGYIFDQACLFWGQTCSKQGNCWLYDNDLIKYTFNITAGMFILVGTFWDMGTWYYSKNVKIFDEEKEKENEKKDNVNR